MHVIAQSEIFQVECDVAIVLRFHMPIVTDLTDCDRTGWSLFKLTTLTNLLLPSPPPKR